MARIILFTILWLGAAFQTCAEHGQLRKSGDSAVTQEQARREILERIIISKFTFYASNFPNIDFVLLDSGGNLERNLGIVLTILGQDPEPLDYSHPESVRQILLEATYTRIGLLLQHGIGSATLFAPGQDAKAKRKQVCIVTMNPWKIAHDNHAATMHLLELPESITTDVMPDRYLDADTHLRYAIDHEIYHCLDTSINGPVPMSMKEHWGGYYMLRNEAGADAFAVLMHLTESGSSTQYARNLSLIRSLTLLNGDLNHYTYPSLAAVLKIDRSRLAGSNVHEIFRLASQIRDKVVGSYQDYIHYAAAAQSVMKRLGVTTHDESFTDITADPATIERLTRQVKSNYRELMGHEVRAAK